MIGPRRPPGGRTGRRSMPGTYRVVDGRVSGAPRTASMQEAPGLPGLLVGRTLDGLASSL